MYKINGNSITLTRGDSFYTTVTMKNKETGESYTPQEGDVIRFGLKQNIKDTSCLIEKTIPNDTLMLHLEPGDTANLPFGKYVYDMELTFANGDVDTFINNESFVLAPEVI